MVSSLIQERSYGGIFIPFRDPPTSASPMQKLKAPAAMPDSKKFTLSPFHEEETEVQR